MIHFENKTKKFMVIYHTTDDVSLYMFRYSGTGRHYNTTLHWRW